MAAAALAVRKIPAFPALRPAALSAHAEVRFFGNRHAELAAAKRRTRTELPIPPAAVGRKHGDAILFAQPASAMIEHPAVLLAGQQTAARATERDAPANPAAT